MNKKATDYLVRGVLDTHDVRFIFTETTETVTEGILLHNCDPAASHLFARALTVAALTVPLLENSEKYSIRWQYDGKAGTIITEATAKAHIRGLCGSPSLINCSSMEEIYGDRGVISLMKSDNGTILNSGQSQAGLLDITGDISFFFSTSDQIETEIKAVISFNSDPDTPVEISSGFMIQALPDCDLRKFDLLRSRMLDGDFESILSSKTLSEEAKIRKLINYITEGGNKFEFHFANTPVYRCTCSEEKMKEALKVLKKEEIEEIFAKNAKPSITCHFCNKTYAFTKQELQM